MNSNFMKLNPSKLLNPDCPLEAFPIVGASLLAKFFASKLAPTVGSRPDGLSGLNVISCPLASSPPLHEGRNVFVANEQSEPKTLAGQRA